VEIKLKKMYSMCYKETVLEKHKLKYKINSTSSKSTPKVRFSKLLVYWTYLFVLFMNLCFQYFL